MSSMEKEKFEKRVEISVLKYFWQSSPFASSKRENVPRFLREIEILKNFTDMELCTLGGYLHRRIFSPAETVFKEGDIGFGFYFIFSGSIELLFGDYEEMKIVLGRGDYFGELALLQDNSIRSATAKAPVATELFGLLRPDLEELIEHHPVIATKLLQTVSLIIANRLIETTEELATLKSKLSSGDHGRA